MPLLFSCVLLLFSLTVSAESLLDIVIAASKNEPTYKISKLNTKLGHTQLDTAWTFAQPNISLSSTKKQTAVESESRGVYDESIGGFIPQNNREKYNDTSVNLVITQKIYDHRFVAFADETSANRSALDMNAKNERQNFLLRVSQLYFDTVYAADIFESALRQKQALQSQLKLVELQFEVGTVSNIAVQQIKAAYDSAEVAFLDAQNRLQQQHDTLKSQVGIDYHSLNSITGTLPLKIPSPSSVDEWITLALENNPLYLASISQHNASHSKVRRAEAQYVPSLDLSLRYGNSNLQYDEYVNPLSSFVNPSRESSSATVELTLTVPLYNAPILSQIDEAVIEREIAKEQARSSKLAISLQTKNSYAGLQSSIQRVRALEQSLTSFKVAEDAIRAGFSVGVQSSSDLIDAIANTSQATTSLSRSRYDYLLNLFSLYALTGNLTLDIIREYDLYIR